MSRAWRLNAVLAAAVAALGALVYFMPAREGAVEFPVSTLAAAQVKAIRIERAGAVPVLLEKREAGWFIAAPFAARAEASRVERLLEIVGAKAASRLPAADLARFGLARPEASMTVDGQTFAFGMVNAVTREQYVLSGGAVYVLPPYFGSALPASAADLASRQLFGPAEAPARFELEEFTVEQRDGRWTLSKPSGGLSQDDLIRWVDAWRLASALRVEPHAGSRAPEKIEVQLRSGARITLGVLAREPELVLVRSDEGLVYRLGAASAQRLLSPPGSEAEHRKP